VRAGVPAVVAGLLSVALMIGAYLLLPEPSGDDPPVLVFISMVVIGVVYCAAAVWALMRLHTARHPLTMGFVMLAVMVTAMVAIFALAYLSLSADNPGNFNVPLDKVSALYFTMTVLATVGFGDIHAVTHAAMIAVMLQMVVGLTLLTALARVVAEAARRAARKRYQEGLPIDPD
jgi:hypothetical protein